MVSKVLFTTT